MAVLPECPALPRRERKSRSVFAPIMSSKGCSTSRRLASPGFQTGTSFPSASRVRSYTATERTEARWFHPHILDMHVGQVVSQMYRALGRVRIETLVERRREPSRNHR